MKIINTIVSLWEVLAIPNQLNNLATKFIKLIKEHNNCFLIYIFSFPVLYFPEAGIRPRVSDMQNMYSVLELNFWSVLFFFFFFLFRYFWGATHPVVFRGYSWLGIGEIRDTGNQTQVSHMQSLYTNLLSYSFSVSSLHFSSSSFWFVITFFLTFFHSLLPHYFLE